METRELELKDIIGNIPHKLFCLCRGVEFCANEILNAHDNTEVIFSCNFEPVRIHEITPILRPLSDLYKTITHNGKEIIPIVELAKIYSPAGNWYFHDLFKEALANDYRFGYSSVNRCFSSKYKNYCNTVYNQYQLFDYLHELKIDYRGLIDAGLAISVYDLENNPYK